MADKRKAEEEKRQYAKRQKTKMEAQNNPLSQKPAPAPQKSTNLFQSFFAGLLGRQKKQELVVTQQNDLSKQQSTSADIVGDLTSAAMTAKTAQIVADGSVQQETATARESLTAKDSVTAKESAAKTASVAKGQTAPMAAQELQSKQGVAEKGQLKTNQKLTAQPQVSAKAGVKSTQAGTAAVTAKSQEKLTSKEKLTTKATQTVSTTTDVKPGVKQKVSTTVVKQKSATVKTTTAQRVNLQRPLTQKEQAAKTAKQAQKTAPQTQNIRMLTNEDGKVTDIFLSKFRTVNPTSRAQLKGVKPFDAGKQTADKISGLKKIIRQKGKEKGESIKMSR